MCKEDREWERVGFLMATKNSNDESLLQAYDLQSMRVNHFSPCCKTLRQVLVLATITEEDAEGQGS